ncbi:MAG: hypothetical protein ACI8TX_001111 [Hyphomicrobiaceae bacterium]|jgi:hypothetical protein
MADEKGQSNASGKSGFSAEANEQQVGIVGEFTDYLRHNKKWWLTPIIIVLMMVGALVVFGGTAAAPFIYTLF